MLYYRQYDSFYDFTVNVLKFRTLVAFQKGLDEQRRPRSDCFRRSSLIRVNPVCYSNKHFVNSRPENQHFIWDRKKKVLKILKHLPYVQFIDILNLKWFLLFCMHNRQVLRFGFSSSGFWKFWTFTHGKLSKHMSWPILVFEPSHDFSKFCKGH